MGFLGLPKAVGKFGRRPDWSSDSNRDPTFSREYADFQWGASSGQQVLLSSDAEFTTEVRGTESPHIAFNDPLEMQSLFDVPECMGE